ncbi:MAG: TIGR00270 family protein [Candidatus Lokiarchaeota archaeon]|nr:TIGR00270 family protein [Candidatus Lokiarchaeota archaeon]
MPKPQYNEIDKECPICGSIIWGKGQRVLLEGAKITVCHNCARYGKNIQKPPTSKHINKSFSHDKSTLPKRPVLKKSNVNDLEIIQDYAKKIRNLRSSLGLNQDQFAQRLNEKPSLLRRIEAGKVKPTIKLAKKIEDVYKIKILKKPTEIEANVESSKYMKKSSGTSLGDIAFIKKKK